MKRLAIALLALWPPAALAAQSPKELTEAESVLETLVESYGPSGMEGPVREAVRKALPSWANPQTDSAGNLWVTLGQGEPTVVFVAHLDEVGFVVRGIEESGLLALEPLGGIFPELWESRPALVHTGTTTVPGVFQPHDSSGALRVDRRHGIPHRHRGARRSDRPHAHHAEAVRPARGHSCHRTLLR